MIDSPEGVLVKRMLRQTAPSQIGEFSTCHWVRFIYSPCNPVNVPSEAELSEDLTNDMLINLRQKKAVKWKIINRNRSTFFRYFVKGVGSKSLKKYKFLNSWDLKN